MHKYIKFMLCRHCTRLSTYTLVLCRCFVEEHISNKEMVSLVGIVHIEIKVELTIVPSVVVDGPDSFRTSTKINKLIFYCLKIRHCKYYTFYPVCGQIKGKKQDYIIFKSQL